MLCVLVCLLCCTPYISGETVNETETNSTADVTGNVETELLASCPPREEIPNCRCEKRAPFGVMVDCVEFPYPEVLRENLDGLFGYQVGMLNIAQPEFAAVDAEFFQNVSLHRLDISQWNITSLKSRDNSSKSFLSSLRPCLVQLGVVNCPLMEEWDWTLLRDMKKLTHLYVTATPVKTIQKTLSSLTSLQAITFYGTKTDSVEDGALRGLTNLVALTIKDNHLLVIDRTTLPSPALHLHYLGLGANNISVLPDDLFTAMPQLKYLELDNNLLKSLKKSTLEPVYAQLLLVIVEGNPFHCDEELQWLVNTRRPEQNDFNQTVCQSPANLTGRSLESMHASNLE